MISPFIYRRSLDFPAIEEIKALKKKIDDTLKKKNLEKGNIKLGAGGIREIEFIVQAYQLLFGGRDKSLREPNTLITLQRLRDRDFITQDEYQGLEEAYVFLRKLENMVQISFGLQTHILPKGLCLVGAPDDLTVPEPEMCPASFKAVNRRRLAAGRGLLRR